MEIVISYAMLFRIMAAYAMKTERFLFMKTTVLQGKYGMDLFNRFMSF